MNDLNDIKYWLFDLDNTLYDGATKVFDQVDKKMSKFISEKLNVSIEEAINLPHLCSRNKFSEIEKQDFDLDVYSNLKLLGHDIVKKEMNSGLNIIWKYGDFWGGASDQRREGVAVGF